MKHSSIFCSPWLIGLAFFPLIISYFVFIYIASSPHWDTDYLYLYFSAKQAIAHSNIYYPMRFFSASLNGLTEMVNLNPPPLALLMMPFGLMNYTHSFWAWSILNLVFAVCGVFLIIKKLFNSKEKHIYLMSIFLLFAYFPMFINLYAQTGILVFFLTTLGWYAYRENKFELAGVFLGLAFSMKLFIGLFLWLFLWRREWRCLTIFLCTAVLVACLSILVLGPLVYLDYYHVFSNVHWYSASWNASLLGFFSRLFGYLNENNQPLLYLPQLTPWLYVMAVVLCLSTFVFFKKQQQDQTNQLTILFSPAEQDFGVAYTIVVMLLISPLAWIYYFLLLLIPSAIVFYWNQRVFHQRKVNVFLAVALLCSSIPQLLLKPHQIIGYHTVFLWSGCYFYALSILLVLIFKLHQHLKTRKLCAVETGVMLECNSYMLRSLLTLFMIFLPSFLGILIITHSISAAR